MIVDAQISLSDIRSVFPRLLEQAALAARVLERGQIYRIQIPILPCNRIEWLRNQDTPIKIYWSSRDTDDATAGTGSADQIDANKGGTSGAIVNSLTKRISSHFPKVRYYGGFCFDPQRSSNDWKEFKYCHFTVPRFEITGPATSPVFACNIRQEELNPEAMTRIAHEFNRLIWTARSVKKNSPKLISFKDFPHSQRWQSAVKTQIKNINRGTIKKIVLARQAILKFDAPLDTLQLFKRLANISPHCYHFYFQLNTSSAFIGASPERLYRRTGLSIQTEALAGTSPRGDTPMKDKRQKQSLLNSEKDWNEHQLVADWIRNIVNPMCGQFQSDRTFSVVSLKSGHHLITRMQGRLLETVDDAMLLERLHPTPAVAGWPKDESLRIIRAVEPFNRGYYAAPVGYIGLDEAEFAVAIRSGIIRGNQAKLYAGAGLVNASQPQAEWDETENKLKIFLTALGL